METYQPINCGLYDYLEAAATLQRQVSIYFLDGDETKLVATEVKNLYIKNKVEYLITSKKEEIRLDMITSFDGHDFTRPHQCDL